VSIDDRDSSGLSRRGFLGGAAATTLWGALSGCGPDRVGPPNVLLIVADDLGYECLGCNGGTSYYTPFLDDMAASGIRFTQAYTTPLCTPSRVQLMSGQYPFRTGVSEHLMHRLRDDRWVEPSVIDLAGRFKSAGYSTAVAGKWQLAMFGDHPHHANEAGFDEYCLWTWDYQGTRESFRRYWRPGVWQNGKLNRDVHRDDVYGPDVFSGFLIDFMRRNRELPFFAYYPMVLPHRPYGITPASSEADGAEGVPDARRYAGMVAYMDHLVGRMLHTLDDIGLREDTLVIFTSDNGTPDEFISMMGDTPVRGGKGRLVAPGGHVPFLASWPGTVPAGRVTDALTDSTDLRPTLAEIAGVDPGPDRILDGKSLVATLRGEAGGVREWVYVQLYDQRVIRDRRWKLRSDGQFFDLASDPEERTPLAAGEGGEVAQAARERLAAALASLS
jgi:arylsulfatase A